MRAAQKAGDFRVLFPEGVERIDQIPWYLQVAIDHALTILTWYENLPKEDMPPEYLWEDSEGLEMWWKTVEARREDGVPTSQGDADPANTDQPRQMVENDVARFLKG